MVEMRAQGATYAEIGQAAGLVQSSVHDRLHKPATQGLLARLVAEKEQAISEGFHSFMDRLRSEVCEGKDRWMEAGDRLVRVAEVADRIRAGMAGEDQRQPGFTLQQLYVLIQAGGPGPEDED